MKTSTILSLLLSVFSLSAQAEFLVGWIGPLTGNAAVLGVDSAPAIQIAVDEINKSGGIGGERVKLLIEDDQYQASKTISAYHSLVHARGVKVLFMLTYGGLFALADRAEKDGVLVINTLDCDEKIAALNRNIFCIAKTTESLGVNLAETAKIRNGALDMPQTVSSLLKVNGVKGLSGNITIDTDGATRSLEVVPAIFRDGKFEFGK